MNQYCSNCGTRLNGEAFCPKCQTRVSADADSSESPQSPVTGTFGEPGKPYHVTIVGHGFMKMPWFWFKMLYENELSVNVWVDGLFAGTVPPDGRIDLHLDKNPIEVRMCAKAFLDKGCWSTVLQRIEERCCFKIVQSRWSGIRDLHLKKIPVRW